MTGEPLDNHLTDSDSGYFASHTVDREAQTGQEHLGVVGSYSERQGDGPFETVSDRIPFDERSREHQHGRHQAGETYSELVKNDSSEEKEEKENIEEAVSA